MIFINAKKPTLKRVGFRYTTKKECPEGHSVIFYFTSVQGELQSRKFRP